MSLANETMVLSLQVGIWTGYRQDKDAAHDITSKHNADQDAARVNKHLISKEVLAPIISASMALRRHLYQSTFPWKDNGDRLLPRKRFLTFIDEHDKLKVAFDQEVEKFVTVSYPAEFARAEFRMGTLFKPDDYPTIAQLRRKFYVGLDIDAVTEAGDFRCQIEGAAAERLKREVETSVERRIAGVMQEAWTRLADQLAGLYDRLTSEKRKGLRAAYLDNLNALVAMLPDMNVLQDPHLDAIVKRTQAMLQGLDVQDLRTDPIVKKSVSDEAQKIMDSMKGFMTAFEEKS